MQNAEETEDWGFSRWPTHDRNNVAVQLGIDTIPLEGTRVTALVFVARIVLALDCLAHQDRAPRTRS